MIYILDDLEAHRETTSLVAGRELLDAAVLKGLHMCGLIRANYWQAYSEVTRIIALPHLYVVTSDCSVITHGMIRAQKVRLHVAGFWRRTIDGTSRGWCDLFHCRSCDIKIDAAK